MVGEDMMLVELFAVVRILGVVVSFCSLVTGAMKRDLIGVDAEKE